MGNICGGGDAPTDNNADSQYVVDHNMNKPGEFFESQPLLESYQGVFVQYLDIISKFYQGEQTGKVRIEYPEIIVGSTENRKNSINAQFKVQLTLGAVNKILNDIVMHGRLHGDHGIKAKFANVALSEEQRKTIFEACCAKEQDELARKARAADPAAQPEPAETIPMEEANIPTEVDIVLEFDEFVSGLGLVGTHWSTVDMDLGADVVAWSLDRTS